MKSYVIQYNAAECGFRNNNGVNTSLTQEHDDDGEKLNRWLLFVVYLLGYMKSDLYFIQSL